MKFKKIKKLFIISLAGVLSSCGAAGPTYDEAKTSIVPPTGNNSQLIIYRPDAFAGIAFSTTILINGVKACDLPNASFFVKNVSEKEITLSTSMLNPSMNAQAVFKAEPKKQYYIRVSVDEPDAVSMGAVFGLTGVLATKAASTYDNPPPNSADPANDSINTAPPGAFHFIFLDEKAALPELPPLKMKSNCQ